MVNARFFTSHILDIAVHFKAAIRRTWVEEFADTAATVAEEQEVHYCL